MPLYEYRCEACSHQFEVIQKFSDEPIAVCPKCGSGPVAKLRSSPAFQFKGTGWYITDYAQKGKSGGDAPSSGGDSAGKDDSKSDKKPEGASTDASKKSDSASTPPPAATPTKD